MNSMAAVNAPAMASLSFDEAATAQMERIVTDLRRMYLERNEALREVTRAHHDALLRLSLAADLKDDDMGVHIVRIGFMAEALALWLGEDAEFARMLRKAAPMHDIGKIGIPDSVLKKPGPLTPDERAVMNCHAAMGADILARSRIPLFQLAAEVALCHHERHDGRGYPAGMAGEQIPLSARIVAVADYFDALTMDRVYRPALPDAQALAMLRDERGHAFDPRVVDCFVAHAPALIALRDRLNRQHVGFEDLLD
jgi:putative two-component system response regulator